MTGLPTLASVRSSSARETRRAIGGLLKRDDERGLERLLAKHDMACGRVVAALSKGSQSRSLLVTSPLTGDDRPVLAIALARAFAAQGGRVLLVDADERHGVLSRLFATDGELGLREVLDGGTSLADAVIEDSKKRLSFLPRGKLQPRDLAQFKPEVVAQRLTAAASGFDWVIVDAGAVVGDTAARKLADLVDDIILAVRAARTQRSELSLALETLSKVRSKLRGTVLVGTAGGVD